MFIMIILDKVERYIPALIGAALVLGVVFLLCMHSTDAVVQTLNLHSMTESQFWYPGSHAMESTVGINWTTIIFIAGMMIMVEGMGHSGFFRWLCLLLAKAAKYRLTPLFILFMVLSAFLSMFIDSITVLLFLAVVTIELSRVLKFDPVPLIITEIFTANLGGAATMSGDPPNIIIGTSLGYSFMDFVVNTGPIVLVSLAIIIPFFCLVFRKELKAHKVPVALGMGHPEQEHHSAAHLLEEVPYIEEKKVDLVPRDAIVNRTHFLISVAIFLLTVALLVTHAATGLSVATVGVIAAVLTLVTSGKTALAHIKKLDWQTLLFFIGLFVVVGGLEQTGVLEMLANLIAQICGGNIFIVIAVILWFSAIASALVDNIPFAATMVPIIKALSVTQGFDLHALAWTLSLGTDIGGNGTPIGASANVCGTAISAKEGHPISWGRYCKFAAPAAVLTVAICMAMLFVFHT
jgi:Na+/H+ antiporter NhaD/arsenite permease-like protein